MTFGKDAWMGSLLSKTTWIGEMGFLKRLPNATDLIIFLRSRFQQHIRRQAFQPKSPFRQKLTYWIDFVAHPEMKPMPVCQSENKAWHPNEIPAVGQNKRYHFACYSVCICIYRWLNKYTTIFDFASAASTLLELTMAPNRRLAIFHLQMSAAMLNATEKELTVFSCCFIPFGLRLWKIANIIFEL